MQQLHPQLYADTVTLGLLPLSRVLLMNDAQYPWLILVPQRAGITEVFQLSAKDRQQLDQESCSIASILMTHFQADKLNIAALGNLVPQLHIHHIVRFKSDAAWPKPVWGTKPSIPYSKEQLAQRSEELIALLEPISGFEHY